MLNIGRLGQGAVNYYVGEVATSADDYYTGHGEAPGRWVGSLAARMGLQGRVDEGHFRAVLEGRDPFTGEYLISARGSAARATARRKAPAPRPLTGGPSLDTLQAACQLGVSEQWVRHLLAVGDQSCERRAVEISAGAPESPFPKSYLIGTRAESAEAGRATWRIPQEEVDRFLATRKPAKARPGYDLVLRPPKSVSILWALGDDHIRSTVRRAHAEAVDETVRFLELQAVSARSKGARTATYGLVAAAFDHRTSRAADPLLHTHVVTANMTRTVDGQWRTLDGRGLFDHGRAGGAVYQAHLRHLLTRDLGVAWEPVTNGHADIAGIPRDLIELFSKRREEISEMVAEAGLSSARAHQAATLASRQAKERGLDDKTLEARWRAEASTAGHDLAVLSSCLGRTAPEPVTPERRQALFTRLASPHGLTERAASFARDDVLAAIAASVVADVDATELGRLADSFLASEHVVPLVGAETGRQRTIMVNAEGDTMPVLGELRYSTPELIALERQVLAAAADGFGTPAPVVGTGVVEAVIAAHPHLSPEQIAMVRAVCRADTAVQPVVGRAGSGKTHALRACVDAFVASGIPVVGCSVSATAAARLEESTQLRDLTGRSCDTVARLLVELDGPGGGFSPGTVCIVDEASALGTRDLARLLEYLRRAGGALKLVGDPDQLSSVDVGGAFRAIAASQGERLITLNSNHRQQDEDERCAVSDYREGRIAEALARYDAAGKVIRSPTLSASLDAMAADWYADRQAGINAPMIAGPNDVRRKLNRRARALLKADGTLVGAALTVNGDDFCAGDEIVTRRNDRRLRTPGTRTFVKNGSRGTVVEADVSSRTLLVQFTREGLLRLPTTYLEQGNVEHAYAQTNFLAQGSDQQRTKYHPTDASRFEEGYVGITRAVEQTRIYIVDGTRPPSDDDLVHDTEAVESGLSEIVAGLRTRGAQQMTHDLDSALTALSPELSNLSLGELRDLRRRLETVLNAAPPSAAVALDRAVRRRDQVLARRRALETDQPPRAATVKQGIASNRRIEAIDRELTRLNAAIHRLHEKERGRRHYFAEHRRDLDLLKSVNRAEAARDARVRTAALSTTTADRAEPNDARLQLAQIQRAQVSAVDSDLKRAASQAVPRQLDSGLEPD